ncbi:MAG: nucleotidyl transferase AbiEii/AbiGii toxin family protein [Clostridiales bacterium]|nr:nucleotidyl transferase AbiEii/AbiGii toxin family protein [Clostridiales bacterium]
MVLQELAKNVPNLIFKGGTSLTKCFKAIKRFSEDIDLTLKKDFLTQGNRVETKRIIVDTCTNKLDLILKILNIFVVKKCLITIRYYIPNCLRSRLWIR